MHQLAVVTMWDVEIATQHAPRIASAIIALVAHLTVTLARLAVAAGDTIVRVLGQPATATSERQALVFAIVNAVISVARIDISRIETTGH